MKDLCLIVAVLSVWLFSFVSPVQCNAEEYLLASIKDSLSTPENLRSHNELEQSTIAVNGKIDRNSVYTELKAHGVPASDIISLVNSFHSLFDFKNSKPGDSYRLVMDKDNRLQTFVYHHDPLNYFIAAKSDGGGYTVTKEAIVPEKEITAKEFVLKSSLYKAITSKGETISLVNRFLEIFSWDIDFYLYPRKGDRIQILYEKYTKDGKLVHYGDILAARYIGQKKTHSAFLSKEDGVNAYYDENGNNLRKMFLKVPVVFGVMTSSYSNRRLHPVSKNFKKHNGIDYGAKKGTPVFATAEGSVVFSGLGGGYGNLVIIRHPNGYETYYAHCSKLLATKGDRVAQGQVIAQVGSTGTATGPHVHYEVRVNGVPVNPNSIDYENGHPIKPELLSKHRERVGEALFMLTSLIINDYDTFKNDSLLETYYGRFGLGPVLL